MVAGACRMISILRHRGIPGYMIVCKLGCRHGDRLRCRIVSRLGWRHYSRHNDSRGGILGCRLV